MTGFEVVAGAFVAFFAPYWIAGGRWPFSVVA
jgi:hypothetical protein